MPLTWPRRRFRSPITSPMNSSGVTTSTAKIGSSSTGLALATADVGVDLVLPEHPIDEHFEVQLAHAGDLGLSGLLVGAHLEGGVLFGEPRERGRHLLLVRFGLRLDRDLDHRLWEYDRLELD